jgi:protein-tyrosine phosphatase
VFEIVVICTGNRNRSPIAEACLRQATAGLPVTVSSAGLLDLGEVPPLPETVEVAHRIGLDITGHRARCITGVDLSRTDLVLGLEWEHVAAAVVDHRASSDRAFTLLELPDLLEGVPAPPLLDPVERARALIQAASAKKSLGAAGPLGVSVSDPFGGPRRDYHQMAIAVQSAADRLAGHLFAVSPRP